MARRAARSFMAVVCALFLTACSGRDYAWVVKIDGREIPPSMFVTAQMQSYIEAQVLAADEEGPLLESEIEGIPARQWINEKAVRHLKNFCFIEKEFDRRGLTTDSQSYDFMDTFGEEGWASISRLYEANDIPADYYMQYLDHICKEQMVFNDIYMEGGEKEVSEEEIEAYLNQRLCRVSVFTVSKADRDGEIPRDGRLEEVSECVEQAVSDINSGKDFQQAANAVCSQVRKVLETGVCQDDVSVTTFYLNSNNIDAIPVFSNELFGKKEGRCIYYETRDKYYICQKQDFASDSESYPEIKQSVVNIIKADEFRQYMQSRCDDMQVEINSDALNFYSPSKIKTTIN